MNEHHPFCSGTRPPNPHLRPYATASRALQARRITFEAKNKSKSKPKIKNKAQAAQSVQSDFVLHTCPAVEDRSIVTQLLVVSCLSHQTETPFPFIKNLTGYRARGFHIKSDFMGN
jgi:hypothetical protein